MLLAVVALCMMYALFNNLPDILEWSSQSNPLDVGFTTTEYDQTDTSEPTGTPPGIRAPKAGEPIPHTFDGDFKFYRLASSLHGAAHTNGYRAINRNIIFAMSSLRSASTMLPMICEMANWSRNWVHAVFMGREDLDLTEILEINGIDQIKCPAIWHDARPDHSEYSSDDRAESVVMTAMTHIHTFLHPQAAIIDDALSEDGFFVKGMRARTKSLGMPLIEIPKDKVDSMMWMTRLDAGSLRSWHLPAVDILIQVPPGSSGVARLLRSIRSADYSGVNLPHITIELPADVDESVERYLDDFKWPVAGHQSHITTRRRIGTQRLTQEESAIRFLELFYPSSKHSHLLLLSPQVELSSQYYQYLMYTLLEYRHSTYSVDDAAGVFGTTLEIPSTLLDGKTAFTGPKADDMHSPRYSKLFANTNSAPFLWQSPNSHATLVFGDKWSEFHSFVSNRVAKQSKPRHKLVSETLPAWMEYMLEFMRARGYALFYPGAASRDAFVTIHNELYRAPEEFLKPTPLEEETTVPSQALTEPFSLANTPAPPPKGVESYLVSGSRPVHLVLPFGGDLPEIADLPYFTHNGEEVPHSNVASIASTYADKYREVIGGCESVVGKHRKVVPGSARDLFCFGNEEESDWEDDTRTYNMDDGDENVPVPHWTGETPTEDTPATTATSTESSTMEPAAATSAASAEAS